MNTITIGQYTIKPYAARSGFTTIIKAHVLADGKVIGRYNSVAAAKAAVTRLTKTA